MQLTVKNLDGVVVRDIEYTGIEVPPVPADSEEAQRLANFLAGWGWLGRFEFSGQILHLYSPFARKIRDNTLDMLLNKLNDLIGDFRVPVAAI